MCPQPLSAPRPQEEVPVPGRRLPNPRGGCTPSRDRFPIQRGGLLSSSPCPPEPRAPPAFPADRLAPVYSLELLSVRPPPPSLPLSSLLSRPSVDNYRASVTCQMWACLAPLRRCALGAGVRCPGPTGVCIFIGQACAPATALAYAVVFGGSGPSSPSSTL